MRARAVVKKAPAVPKTARIAVGFSGEVTQPSCACSGSAVAKTARPISKREDFFIVGSPVGEGTGTESTGNAKYYFCLYHREEHGSLQLFAIAGNEPCV